MREMMFPNVCLVLLISDVHSGSKFLLLLFRTLNYFTSEVSWIQTL